jgi:hypothetical protein
VADCNGLTPGEHHARVLVGVDGSALLGEIDVRVFNPYLDPDGQPDCEDGVDNDGDGALDLADGGCDGAGDGSEWTAVFVCDNGQNDDGDARADFPFDPGCADPTSELEDPECQDGVDNDGDGGIDFDGGASLNALLPLADADPECLAASSNFEGSLQVPAVGPLGLGALAILLLWSVAHAGRSRPRSSG